MTLAIMIKPCQNISILMRSLINKNTCFFTLIFVTVQLSDIDRMAASAMQSVDDDDDDDEDLDDPDLLVRSRASILCLISRTTVTSLSAS